MTHDWAASIVSGHGVPSATIGVTGDPHVLPRGSHMGDRWAVAPGSTHAAHTKWLYGSGSNWT